MNLLFSAPSKTYLVGEYSVLLGGPALVINSEPRFELRVKKGTGLVAGIPKGSPAAHWIMQNAETLKKWDFEFHDPHLGRGGFGASGAQFLFVHALTTFLQISAEKAAHGLNIKAIWNDHQRLTEARGSGGDILAQALGGISLIDLKNIAGDAKTWPFADLSFAIFKTADKVATHEHVRDLDRNQLRSLLPLTDRCIESFVSGSSLNFVKNFKEFSEELARLNLQSASTLELLAPLKSESWCLAAKGCGALGADTILALFHPSDLNRAEKYFANLGLPMVVTPAQISGGLDMKWSWDEN